MFQYPADLRFGGFGKVRLDRRIRRPPTDGHHGTDVDAALDHVVRRPAPAEVVARHLLPPTAVPLLGVCLGGLEDPLSDGRFRDVDEGVVGIAVAFGYEPMYVFGDVVGGTGVARLFRAAVGVFAANLDEPTVAGDGDRTANIIGRLSAAGIAVSVGVPPENDAAVNTARRSAENVVTAPPFTTPVPETRRRAISLQDDAVATVVTSAPSVMNQSLLEEADRTVKLDAVEYPSANTTSEQELVATIRALPSASEPTDTSQKLNRNR